MPPCRCRVARFSVKQSAGLGSLTAHRVAHPVHTVPSSGCHIHRHAVRRRASSCRARAGAHERGVDRQEQVAVRRRWAAGCGTGSAPACPWWRRWSGPDSGGYPRPVYPAMGVAAPLGSKLALLRGLDSRARRWSRAGRSRAAGWPAGPSGTSSGTGPPRSRSSRSRGRWWCRGRRPGCTGRGCSLQSGPRPGSVSTNFFRPGVR